MSNPGPASTSTVNYPNPSSDQAVGIIKLKNLSVAAAADTFIPLPPGLSSGTIVPLSVYTCNSSGTTADISSATVGIYTLPAAGGTAVLTTAALTGQTTQAFNYARAATAVAASVPIVAGGLYAHVVTTVAGGITDLYLTYLNVS